MRNITKIWLIIAASLVLAGCILFVGVMAMLGWDFAKLSTIRYETNTYEINESFSDILIVTDNANIIFALSDNGKCRVECYEETNAKHSVTTQEDNLVIKVVDTKSWYDYMGICFDSPKITVYLPKTKYKALSISGSTGNVKVPKDFVFENTDISLSTGKADFCASVSEKIKIKTSTGNVCVENITAGSIELMTSTGKMTVCGVKCEGDITTGVSTGRAYLTDVACKSIISRGNTGDIFLNNVIAAEKFYIERGTGDVKFDSSDANEIFVKTSTGNVTGSFLSNKVFITQTDTGDVNVPKTLTGGKCEICTSTGNIKIKTDQ